QLMVVLGGMVWLVCLPVYAQTTSSTTGSDPKAVWGQDTDEAIDKIEKRLSNLQLQSDTNTLVNGVDFFTFSAYDSSTQTVAPVSRLDEVKPPIGLPADVVAQNQASQTNDLGNPNSQPAMPVNDSTQINPAAYLPKNNKQSAVVAAPTLADDTIEKKPGLITRLYDRLVNDGAGGAARLDARIFVNEAAAPPDSASASITPIGTENSSPVDSEVLVNINTPDWRQNISDTPTQLTSTRLKKVNAKAEPYKNIKAALENITADSTPSFSVALPRLRQVVENAARAVGYYELDFRLNNAGNGTIDVIIDNVGEPVKIATNTLDIRGQMQLLPESETIAKESPKPNEVFHHGEFAATKNKIDELGVQKGFFDARWLENSADVLLPDNVADINLVYESGEQYEFDDVVFFTLDEDGQLTSDPDKLPVKLPLLQKLVTFETGEGFDSKKVTQLSNELMATRYFNTTNVETVLPEPSESRGVSFENETTSVVIDQQENVVANISPIEFDVSDDLRAKLQEVSAKASRLHDSPDDRVLDPNIKRSSSLLAKLSDGIKSIAQAVLPDESGDELSQSPSARPMLAGRKTPTDVHQTKKVPLYVFVMADKPRDAQMGIGWGSDTGMRAMARLENNLINKDGYQAGVEASISEINKGANFYVTRPLSHPINDKLIANTKYFEEKIAQSVDNVDISSRTVEAGLTRSIVRPNDWNKAFFLRYRLDDLETNAPRDLWENLPVQFHAGNATQEAVLVGASLSKTISDNLIAPTKGYRQYYALEVGSDKLASDTNMAIAKAGVSGMMSFGDNLYGKDRAHQLIGRLDLGYIWADEFDKVPYKLRFFAGGDQNLRGY
ncbi:MAG: BamA/TamA family outer membrane protein, partial [Moraxella sp.]|nr:BamA/TamA family outer membrane protein [Moraxella sp.]